MSVRVKAELESCHVISVKQRPKSEVKFRELIKN